MVEQTAEEGQMGEELERAKNQLKSMMFSNLEVKPVQMEDIARQILSQGKPTQPYLHQLSINTHNYLHHTLLVWIISFLYGLNLIEFNETNEIIK